MRKYTVERLYELGSYKNIKFIVGVEVGDEDTRSSSEILGGLVKDIYATYFEHEKKLKQLNLAKNQDEKEGVFA